MSEPASDSSGPLWVGEAMEQARAEEKQHRDAAIRQQLEQEAALAEMLRGQSTRR